MSADDERFTIDDGGRTAAPTGDEPDGWRVALNAICAGALSSMLCFAALAGVFVYHVERAESDTRRVAVLAAELTLARAETREERRRSERYALRAEAAERRLRELEPPAPPDGPAPAAFAGGKAHR